MRGGAATPSFIGVNSGETPLLDLVGEAETIATKLGQVARRDRFEIIQRWKTQTCRAS
jgi:hypothetical protein